MSEIKFDEGIARQLEVMYGKRDVLRRRRLVRDALGVEAGHRVLDVGCGPGFYAAELLEDVGPRGAVVGIDGSPSMLSVAARRCLGRGDVAFHEADATSLPLEDQSFDRALSVQVLEYVPDVGAALAEMQRVLRPGGRILAWDVDWSTVSWHSTDPAGMDRVLRAWDRHLRHPALPRTLAPALRSAGFADVQAEGHVFSTIALDPESYGGMALGLLEQYVAALEDVGPDVAKAWVDEQRELGARGEFFFAVVQFCFTATRPR